jgi:hypothetical protein
MTEYAPVLAHIEEYWPRIVRRTPRRQGTLIALPHPYLVPSDGPMWEKYNVTAMDTRPEGGLYGSVPGFGWSNAVFSRFARQLNERST